MWFRSLFGHLKPNFLSKTRKRGAMGARSFRHRLQIELLEDRCVLSFSPFVSYPAGVEHVFGGSNIVAGDFDGNATADIATVGGGVLLSNGDGSFQLQPDSQSHSTTFNAVAADVNNDGRLDLVGTIGIQLGNGDGTFEGHDGFVLPAQFPPGYTGPVSQYPTGVAAGDLNDDGLVDLAVAAVTSYPVFNYYDEYGDPVFKSVDHAYANVLLGQGDGTFTAHWIDLNTENYATSIAIGDLNNDGRLDLVTGGRGVSVLLGNGDGTMQPAQHFGVDGARQLDLGDLNGDGALDVIGSDNFGSGSRSYLGNGDGTLQAARTIQEWYGSYDLALADVSGDGALDLVISSGNSDEVTFYGFVLVQLGRGDGSFTDAQVYSTGATYWPGFVVTGDFNGDGFPDVAISDYSDAADPLVKVMLNDGIWTPPPPPPPPPPPSITVTDVTRNYFGSQVIEGHTGTRVATFGVDLSAAYSQPVTVDFSTADGTATAGTDYQAVAGTLTFAPGERGKIINVLVNGDRVVEWDETYFVNLSGATNATIADDQGLGIIKEDDPRITIYDATRQEGNAGTIRFDFTVRLSTAYDVPVTVDFATDDGSATAGSDYQADSGTLTFAPGQINKTITVLVTGDTKLELDETFTVKLSNPTNATMNNDAGIGTIANDDTATGNNDPIAADDAYELTEDSRLSVNGLGLLANDHDPDGDGLSAFVVNGPAHGTLTLNADGSFAYIPNINYNGSDSFTYKANDGLSAGNVATVSLTIQPVNDPPRFERSSDLNAVDEDGTQSVVWARAVSPGPADETGQALTFHVSVDKEALFATLPAIDSTGRLTFAPARNASGVAIVSVQLQDDGGTAAGGVDLSLIVTFNITIQKLHPWHNAVQPLDVTGDGSIVAGDALEVIDFLNAFSSQPVPTDGRPSGPYYDTDGDGTVAAADALDVINFLNAFGPDNGEGEFNPEPRVPSPEPHSPLDDLLTLLALEQSLQPKRRR